MNTGANDTPIRQVIVAMFCEHFANVAFDDSTSGEIVAVFRAKHPDVGDAVVRTAFVTATVAVGEILVDHFHNFDVQLPAVERSKRVGNDVLRFLQELFDDRLLLWRSVDGRTGGWRERGDYGYLEPIVSDNRPYQRYLWSGPLSVWQAIPSMLTRGRITEDREHEIAIRWLEAESGLPIERDRIRRFVSDYEAQCSI